MLQGQMQGKTSLDASPRYLKGVGPEKAKILARLGLLTLEDLLYFFPKRYENRFPVKQIADLTLGDKECVGGTVISRVVLRTRYGQSIFKLMISDGKRTLSASWFNQPYLNNVFRPKSCVVLYGKAEQSGKMIQMFHPEYELEDPESGICGIHTGRITPIYSLTEDLSQKGLRQFIFRAQENFAGLAKDALSEAFRKRNRLTGLATALRQIHFPDNFQSQKEAYRRLAFEEFFFRQLFIQIKKSELQKRDLSIVHHESDEVLLRFVESLGFELTAGQSRAVEEVIGDMKKDRPMHRLVQGDVGSGKTAVAAAGLFFTAVNGFQGALMAPTEVLAQQHYFNLSQLLEPLGVRLGYLAQNLPPDERQKTLRELESGDIQVLVGTHALIQEAVKFKKLGLAVVDEQHKFGVFQRAALKSKGGSIPHFLLMTATPIPRTLALTLYGELDISTIKELPKDRKPIKTFWVAQNRRREIYDFLDRILADGQQGYVICPWVEGGDGGAKSAVETHREFQQILPKRRIGLLHGRMKSPDKKKVMIDFKEKRLDLLVSTVVIEVGVDVPNATVMVVENAEKFGLAQLHQLRGRVGRGKEESFCVLFSNSTSEESVERLEAFAATQSGFEIAEKDLALRGGGDVAGEKQHGFPELKIGDLTSDGAVFEEAGREAAALVAKDPALVLSEHQTLRKSLERRFGLSGARPTVLA